MNPLDYGITLEEYQIILEKLGREPNHVEMGIFSAMWSEHCSYKHSKILLGQLPTQSKLVVQGPGENAGVVSVDEDWNLVFKIESHNHPSFIAPYDGAATGVGGLLRDVMAMGARPVGVKALLRFGLMEDEFEKDTLAKVRQGALDYTMDCSGGWLGEELYLHPSYKTNPLVNVIVLGLARSSSRAKSGAGSPGNLFLYFGRPTESDYVDGASFASKGMDEETKAKPPSGNPQVGKQLMEATLSMIEAGLIEGIQDMGAAGLTSSSFEMAFKSGQGFEMDLDKIPMTSNDMGAYELLLSETQERMLVSVAPESLDAVLALLSTYPGLSAAVVGRITGSGRAVISRKGEAAADLPVDLVVDGFKRYELNNVTSVKGDGQNDRHIVMGFDRVGALSVETGIDQKLANSIELTPAASDISFDPCAAVLLPDVKKVILLRTLSNGNDIQTDPYQSVYDLVSQAYRDLEAQGALPIGLSDCLNGGNPDDPAIGYQISEGMRGLADACRQLGVPVVGGNVSLYNETSGKPILTQFVIGMVGIKDLE